ncbi:vacuolar protein-sorting-associated protein 36-like [Octopus sinensis]|uniref:Vacuolar protein-sorting-associated protein 36 n=1 Tax=Octopus sinensis TaxID=2607531 RepID=A0A6P7TPG5_9MOLL|nr:vacuolar protein-sorting-associated protein 36-like [Octopus sinensis]
MTKLSRELATKLAGKTNSADRDPTVVFRSVLLSVGIENPVIRGGSDYHGELAQQLHDFLVPILTNVGGVVALAEAFCHYNRARSLSLISPQDMLSAVNRFCDIRGQKIFLKKFESGAAVLMLESFEGEFLGSKVADCLRLSGPLTGIFGICKI